MTVEDPQNEAQHLQMFFPQTSAQMFTCGVPVEFTQSTSHCDILCVDSIACRTSCANTSPQKFLMQAENCSPESVDIVDTIGWSFTAKAQPTSRFGQTWIEDFLNSTDFFISPSGTYTLDFVMPPQERTVVDENGDEVSVRAISIILTFRQSPELSPTSLELILDMDKSGIDQLLYFGFPDHKDYFLKKWGLL